MLKEVMKKNETASANADALAALREHFAGCFTNEGKFDLEAFKSRIRDEVAVTEEGYSLDFLGKNYARLLANEETETVIVPDAEHNAKPENAKSENVYISGDNLDALKHLLKSYEREVKCIYIDPPYNTGSDGFVYNDNFKFKPDELARKLSITEEEAKKLLDFTGRGSASHSAWLMFMYPRLQLAKSLLRDDGVIFISIDDNEQANLKLLCDDIFGEQNYAGCFPWRKRTAKSDVPFGISQDYEWILCYARSDDFRAAVKGGERKYYETPDFPGRRWRVHDMTKQTTATERPNSNFTIVNPKDGKKYPANPNRTWAVTSDTIQEYFSRNEIVFPGDYDFLNIEKPVLRYWEDEDRKKDGHYFGTAAVSTHLPKTVGMSESGTKEITGLLGKVFSFPKATDLIGYFIEALYDRTALIVDFFSGSATTAHAVMKMNASETPCGKRRYILVQLPEVCKTGTDAYNAGYKTIDEIGRARIRKAAEKIKQENPLLAQTMDLGFKHFTLAKPSGEVLEKIEEFDPKESALATQDMLNEFGVGTVLATWMNHDGYGLTREAEKIDLGGYEAYRCDHHLYLVNANFGAKNVKALLEKYETDDKFTPDKIVLFGYSFGWKELEELETNLKKLKMTRNITAEIDIRY